MKTRSFIMGTLVGIGIGVLIAPSKGEDTRKSLKKKVDNVITYIKTSDKDKVKSDILDNLYNLKKYLEELDNARIKSDYEKVVKKIKKEIKNIKDKVKDTSSPYINSLIDDLRNSTLVVLNNIVKKLES